MVFGYGHSKLIPKLIEMAILCISYNYHFQHSVNVHKNMRKLVISVQGGDCSNIQHGFAMQLLSKSISHVTHAQNIAQESLKQYKIEIHELCSQIIYQKLESVRVCKMVTRCHWCSKI